MTQNDFKIIPSHNKFNDFAQCNFEKLMSASIIDECFSIFVKDLKPDI